MTAGMPLGGIGAGKIEFFPHLAVGGITFMNNWSSPLDIRGFHVALKKENLTFLDGIPANRALFPEIEYEVKGCQLTVYSPLTAGDLKDSSLPVVFIKVRGKGRVAISFPNIVGSKRSGRANFLIKGKVNGVLFKNLKASQTDPRYGQIFLGCRDCEELTGYRYWVPGKSGMIEDLSPFYSFRPNADEKFIVSPYAREEIAGMVAKEIDGEETFVLSWYFNARPYHYAYGHYYENWFSSAVEVAEYALQHSEQLKPKIPLNAEGWIEDALRNSLYVLASTSWLTKDGRFALYETPNIAPLMNTIGAMTWDGASFAILRLFPELVLKVDQLFGDLSEDEIPHDLGEESIEDPIYGASYLFSWADLTSTWILEIYRDYLFSGDGAFLRRNYSRMRKALDWLINQDKDGDFVPDSKGGYDNSYDGTHMYGTSSYVASLFIASIEAFIKASEVLGVAVDPKYAQYLKGAKRSLDSLWNGNYFISWKKGHEINDSCLNSQLLGQFWCDALGLDPVSDDEKILKALNSIYELNYNSSKYCLTNCARPDGSVDTSTDQMRSCWPRVTFAVSALMIMRALETKGIDIAEREWSTISKIDRWDQSSRIDALSGQSVGLTHYIGSPSSWLVYMALKKEIPIREITKH